MVEFRLLHYGMYGKGSPGMSLAAKVPSWCVRGRSQVRPEEALVRRKARCWP